MAKPVTFRHHTGLIAFLVLAVVASAAGVGAGVLTKTYFRTDRVIRDGQEALTRAGEDFSFDGNLSEEQRSYDWIKDKKYEASVYGYDQTRQSYFPIDGLAEVNEEGDGLRILGVGKGMVRLTNTVFSDLRVEIPFDSKFDSEDTAVLLKSSGYDIYDDGFVLKDEFHKVDHFDADASFSRLTFADYHYFPNLRALSIQSSTFALPTDIENMPGQLHVYVPKASYLDYRLSPYWASRAESIFVLKQNKNNVSVILNKNGGEFQHDDGKEFLSLELPRGGTIDFDGKYPIHRIGANFQGWKDDVVGNPYDSSTPIEGDIHLSATWDLIRYQIRFHYDNADGQTPETLVTTYAFWGDTIQTLGGQGETHGDFALIGWSTDKTSRVPDFDLGETLPGSFLYPQKEEYDLYAFWVYPETEVLLMAKEPQSLGPIRYNGAKEIRYKSIPIGDGRFAGYSFDSSATKVDVEEGQTLQNVYTRSVFDDPTLRLYPVFAKEYFTMTYESLGKVVATDEGCADFNPIALPRPGSHGLTDASLTKEGHRFVGWLDPETDVVYAKEEDEGQYPDYLHVLYSEDLTFASFGGEGLEEVRLQAYYLPNRFEVSFSGSLDPTETAFDSLEATYGWDAPLSGEMGKRGHVLSALSTPKGTDVLGQVDMNDDRFLSEGIQTLYREIRDDKGWSDNGFQSDSASIVLSPIWIREHYEITFDMAENQGKIPGPTAQTIEYGEKVSEPSFPVIGQVYNGYTFGGWNLGEEPFDFETILASDAVLRAVWYQNDIPVSFVLNPGDSYAAFDASNASLFITQLVKTGESPIVAEDPAADGYAFLGWYLDPAYGEEDKVDALSSLSIHEPTTLYAKWEAKTFTVTYHAEGHGDVAQQSWSQELTYPSHALSSLPSKVGEPDYSFGGWFRYQGEAKVLYDPSQYVTEDLELYAVWNQATYEIRVRDYSGPGTATQVLSGYHYQEEVAMPDLPKPEGYHLIGFLEAQSGEEVGFPYSMPAKHVDLTAVWELDAHVVTFHYGDGRDDVVKETVYGSLVSAPSGTVSGRTFVGWYLEPTFQTKFDPLADVVKADLDLYARWTVKVSFSDNKNEHSSTVANVTVDYGSKIASYPTSPTEYGFTFMGWYRVSGSSLIALDKSYVFKEDTQVRARWSLATFYVNFDLDGGSGATRSGYYEYKSLVQNPGTPTKSGCDFLGWYNGDSKWNFSSDRVTMAMTLKAHWDSGCLVNGTQVLMADGSSKAVEDLVPGDVVMTFDHAQGQYVSGAILANAVTHARLTEVAYLRFDDDTEVGVVGRHAFYDLDLRTYVYFNKENAADYVGHRFAAYGGFVTLVETRIQEDEVGYSSPVVAGTFNFLANGLLSVADGIEAFVHCFEYGEDMRFDEEAMARDIALYGLVAYEEVAEYYPYDLYEAFNVRYLNVILGKGLTTFEEIQVLYAVYYGLLQQRLNA
ncbi:MAG: InlB B-repeat-containing protein [Bacilli bacterium]|nr:InlB B-repeat-containing protein [Bacilli bacterium]